MRAFFVWLFAVDGDDALRAAIKKAPSPMHDYGFVVFFGLGLTMSGFHGDDEGQNAATVFERGRWDAVKPEMQEFRFLPKP